MKKILLIIAAACVALCGFYAFFEMGKDPPKKVEPLLTTADETEKETVEQTSVSISEISDTAELLHTEIAETVFTFETESEEKITETVMETEIFTETEVISETEVTVVTEVIAVNDPSAPETDTRAELEIPILMYHALTKNKEESSSTVITVDAFEKQIEALSEAGYTSVFFGDLIGYVKEGTPLPEKPILITFDDGYLSNITLGAPILEKYGQKATVAVVGVTIGCNTYKDTGVPIYPHFSLEAARMAYGSRLFDFQSHTYDMHQNELDEDPRHGMLQKENESDEDYIKAIRNDFFISKTLLESEIGNECCVIVYPHGQCTPLADSVLAEMGAQVSVTVESGINIVKMGDMSSLRFLRRFNMDDTISGEALISLLEGDSAGECH